MWRGFVGIKRECEEIHFICNIYIITDEPLLTLRSLWTVVGFFFTFSPSSSNECVCDNSESFSSRRCVVYRVKGNSVFLGDQRKRFKIILVFATRKTAIIIRPTVDWQKCREIRVINQFIRVHVWTRIYLFYEVPHF